MAVGFEALVFGGVVVGVRVGVGVGVIGLNSLVSGNLRFGIMPAKRVGGYYYCYYYQLRMYLIRRSVTPLVHLHSSASE